MNISQDLKSQIIAFIKKELGVEIDEKIISKPPEANLGDFAVPLFSFAKNLNTNPVELAVKLSKNKPPKGFNKIIAVGPYINFFIDTQAMSGGVLNSILKSKKILKPEGKVKKVMVEYFSPNTNKPMTVGHLRNLTLGATISRLYKKIGYKVIKANLYNDRGIAICKSMVAYEKFGKNQKPNKKTDQFVGDFYVKFGTELVNDPSLENLAKEYLIKWENGDKKILSLWRKMNNWVYKGYNQTLKTLHEEKFDIIYKESEIYNKGKDIVLKNLGKGIIKKGSTGEVYADLESQGIPNKILLRSDGTSLYITQDLYLAELKDKFKLDMSLNVIADEQNLQMQQLFAILKSLGAPDGKYIHVTYGMMRLPEGKIKSREGFGRALADALVEELESLALSEVSKRQADQSKVQQKKVANQIMNAALKFYILNVDPKKLMIFDPAEAVSFSGKTGPYLQYTVVRLNSILKKLPKVKKADYSLLNHEIEKQIMNKLREYFEVVQTAAINHDPSHITKYLYDLAQTINHYYHEVPVTKSEKNIANARAVLLSAVIKVMTDLLEVCGIEVPQKM